jgi:hypothetical protein
MTDIFVVFNWKIYGKTAILLGVLRVTISKVVLAYMNHGKTTPVKKNSG